MEVYEILSDDEEHQRDQSTVEYQKLITLLNFEREKRDNWLISTRTSLLNGSVLKSAPKFPQDQRTTYTVQEFYAGGIPLEIHIHIMDKKTLPPPLPPSPSPPPKILYKSKKNLDRMLMKKHRAFGDVISTKISYQSKETNSRFLPTRAFANVMNFLEIPQRKLCYSMCCQWTIKFKKMYDTNYPLNGLMAGPTNYLNNKEVLFSKQCYGRKGPSIEELSEMYKNEKRSLHLF
jgi:hypothetical protein